MKKLGIYIYNVLFGLAFLMSASNAYAQNNLYKIDDDCYKIMEAMNFRDDERVFMEKTKKMYELSLKKKDTKAQTIAVCQRMLYYDQRNMLQKLRKQAELLRQEALKTGHKQYYYFAFSREIEHLLESDVEESLRMAKRMLVDANSDTYQHGKFISYQELGNVYKARQNIRLSTEYYNKALEIAPTLTPKQRTTNIYLSLADLSKNLTGRKNYYTKAMDAALETRDSFITYEAMCITYGSFNKKEEFNNCYTKALDLLTKLNTGIEISNVAKAYHAGFQEKYDDAYILLGNSKNDTYKNEVYTAGENIATWAGNGQLALYYAMEREKSNSDIFNNHRGFEFAEINELIENEKLRSQKAEQDRRHATMTLDAKNLEIARKELEEENHRLALIDVQMNINNRLAEAEMMKNKEELKAAQAEKKFLKEKDAQKEQAYMRYSLITIISVLAIVTAIVVALLFYYRYTGIHLLRYAKILHRARNEAQEASAMKNIFIQNMSHEIRTPLNAVMGFSQLMTIPGLPLSEEEKVEYAEHILNNSKMLTMLVDDILNTADIEKGNYSVKMTKCSVNEILAAAISTAEYRAQDGVRIYYTSDVEDDYMVVTDPRRTQQVLINFLTNACKHTDKGSIHLHLSLSETPGMLTFSVTDTGCGIPKEQAENIFDRFTKLNDFKQGTGLGLNICRLISKKMGGKVYCDTRYTDGARFVFVLPLTLSENEETK